MRKWVIVVACALVGLVAIYVTIFRGSDEDRIRETLTRFARAVEVKQDDNILSRAGRIKSQLKEIVDDGVRVDVSELGIGVTGRAKFVEDATKAGLVFTSAACEFVGTTIKIDEARTTAQVDTTAVVTGVRGGERRIDRRSVHFLLRNDGGWRITTVDVAPPQAQ
jgi:hypothetical protein